MRSIDLSICHIGTCLRKLRYSIKEVKKHIGIYSGTFDPIHSGHIAFASETLETCGLDKVIFLPESFPRKKQGVTDLHHRVELIKRAIRGIFGLAVVSIRSGQFSVKETLPKLKTLFPDAHFTFLFGSDVVKNFSKQWSHLDQLLTDSDLAIGMRDPDNEQDIIRILENLKDTYDIAFTYTLIRTVKTAVTSSHIRQGLKDVAQLHADVDEYIENNQLYKS